MKIPELFLENMRNFLGSEYLEFEESLHEVIPVSIRLNPNKLENSFSATTEVPWTTYGRYLPSRPNFTLDPFFHAGHYYVQEASSMILSAVLENIKLPKNSICLDMCAAPGGKSSLILDYLNDSGILHAHEFNPIRAATLKANLQRWGRSNIILSNGNTSSFDHLSFQYDLILIDAPCSGEGMFRKEEKAIVQWNQKKIEHCSIIQKDLLAKAFKRCKPGGYIIYSTCTYNQEENENVCLNTVPENFISLKLDLEIFGLKINHKENIYTHRSMPHRVKGEGFTFAVFQNIEENKATYDNIMPSGQIKHELPESFSTLMDFGIFNSIQKIKDDNFLGHKNLHLLYDHLKQARFNIIVAGLQIGHYKGLDWFPHHALSQATLLSKNFPAYELTYNEAVDYLRANNNLTHQDGMSTWQLATYKSVRLGWIKKTSDRLKNYLPKELRIISY